MSITSLSFLLFVFLTIIIYYILPKKTQWIVLLVASVAFYLIVSINGAIYVLITATTIYVATRIMQNISDKRKNYFKENKGILSKEEKRIYKNKANNKRKVIMIIALLLNIGILCFFKYCHFAIDTTNSIISLFGGVPIEDTLSIIVPLGISFYTFQAVGYLVDVYWEYYRAETNYFKALLFVCFFPQMTQGPISDFEQLSKELFTEHKFTFDRFESGCQRMIWGFFKKMVVADTLSKYVTTAFTNYSSYSGVTTLLAAFTYSIQIYADFSGYMDIMCGLCEILGIKLTENFERPYFSKNIAEYWRRWHITMGTWFKKYIYFPIAMSNWGRKLGKKTSRLGKHFSETFPATIALIITWGATGLWHGASWAYIVWGLVNGLFIILSLWMEPLYQKSRNKLHINVNNFWWKLFQVLRTFILVTFIKVIPEVGSLSDGLGFIGNIFTSNVKFQSPKDLLSFVDLSSPLFIIFFMISIIGILLMLIVSILQRKKSIRYRIGSFPIIIKVLIFVLLLFVIASFGVQSTWDSGGFLYAQF